MTQKRVFTEAHKIALSEAIKKGMTLERRRQISESTKKGMTKAVRQKISDSQKGKTAHNKGKFVYGKKVYNYKNGLPNYCNVHGLHFEWAYYEKSHSTMCKPCTVEKSVLSQRNPKNKLKRIFQDARTHARVAKRQFGISLKDLEELLVAQDNKCALSGVEFSYGLNAPSLDRINSSLDYIIGNIQFLTVAINRMKSNFDQSYFIDVCKQVAFNNVKTEVN